MNTNKKILIGSIIGLVVGVFLPWIKVTAFFGSLTFNGMDGQNGTGDGIFFLIGAGLLAISFYSHRWSIWTARLVSYGLAILTSVKLYQILDGINEFKNSADSEMAVISAGVGLWVLAAASIAALIGAHYGTQEVVND